MGKTATGPDSPGPPLRLLHVTAFSSTTAILVDTTSPAGPAYLPKVPQSMCSLSHSISTHMASQGSPRKGDKCEIKDKSRVGASVPWEGSSLRRHLGQSLE